jgi:hypothetical protein
MLVLVLYNNLRTEHQRTQILVVVAFLLEIDALYENA